MFDSSDLFSNGTACSDVLLKEQARFRHRSSYHARKRIFDLAGAIALLPVMLGVAIVVMIANRKLNPGPLFYSQTRMGKDCVPFQALKFRTMICADTIARGAFDALEHDRITPFGRLLRKTRLDELPQTLNILRGDMSLIGPRPDFYDHAIVYLDAVHGYRERHSIRPGISGYAQVRHGYIEGIEGVRAKVTADLQYIAKASTWVDMKIAWATIKVVLGRQGM
ncbi:sugar transferase [Loktanella sp. R86503]|uniref:sugar transferase n=1 Tax=Loktanella sp. R86503 TaxID=3093847 RepID=UPI0036DEBD8A